MSSTPVSVTRTGPQTFTARNPRGAQVRIGSETDEGVFTPGELLLAAAAGCVGQTSEQLLLRRVGQDAALELRADRTKETEDAHAFASVDIDLDVDLSGLDERQRAAVVQAVHNAVGKLCTVSRTLEHGVPVTVHLD